MEENFILDDMVEGDLDEVSTIEKLSFPLPWSRDLFARELEHDYSNNIVARWPDGEGSKIVGFIVFWEVADEIHILDLAVQSEFRRKGIAKSLIEYSLEVARKKGSVRAFLDVRASNKEAMKLYRYFDFKEVAVREKYYKDGEDAIVMSCNLLKKFYGINDGIY